MSRQQIPLIQVKDLKKYYPVKTGIIPHVTDYVKAVDGVSFSIYEGEILGLVGESGCGKTTIGKLLTSGKADGRDDFVSRDGYSGLDSEGAEKIPNENPDDFSGSVFFLKSEEAYL